MSERGFFRKESSERGTERERRKEGWINAKRRGVDLVERR